MSRLFLMVFVAGMLAVAPTAGADVPNCDCLDDYDVTWPGTPANCLFVCPGAWGLPGHNPGQIADNQICLYKDQNCTDPLVGFDNLRIDLTGIVADSICVCDSECGTFPYIMPTAATDANGCTSFRFQGSILQLEQVMGTDVAWLEVSGCQDRPVRFRGPDVDANCDVGLADFAIFGAAFIICPGEPTGYQHYTVYTGHCAPCPQPALADFAIFGAHFGHTCTPGACDPL